MEGQDRPERLEIQPVNSNYFDLDDILAISESTPCTFSLEELNPEFFPELLGFDKPSSSLEEIAVDAPLWLLEHVRTQHSIHLPQAYSVNMQSVLNADARNVNLARQEQNFYINGIQLCQLMKRENPEGAHNLSKCLLSTLTQRLGEIVSNATHARKKADKLDNLEARVFEDGKKCKQDIDTWLRQDLQAGTSKKRKRNNR